MANKKLANILQKLQDVASDAKNEIKPLSDEEAEALDGGGFNGSCETTNSSCGPNKSCGGPN